MKEFKRLLELCKEENGPFPAGDIRAHLPKALTDNPKEFIVIEEALGTLDPQSWETLKIKLNGRYKRDPLRSWSQFFAILAEAEGFAFLHKKGFKSIRLAEETGEKGPDVEAEDSANENSVFLEAKSIGMSDKERSYLKSRKIEAREVEYGLPEGLKNKFVETIRVAEEQLLSKDPDNSEAIRYVYLKFNPDIHIMLQGLGGVLLIKKFLIEEAKEHPKITLVFNNEILS